VSYPADFLRKYLKKSGSFNFDIKPQTFKQHILNNDGLLVLFSTVFFISITMRKKLAKDGEYWSQP
jgi:hypothetical protein